MASGQSNISFNCPKCAEPVSALPDKVATRILCPHCVKSIVVPSQIVPGKKSQSEQSIDSLIEGIEIGDDPTAVDPTAPIKIDGLTPEASDDSSWHIRCHVCDSVLSVSDEMVGSTIKCNDCYSILKVKPALGKSGTQRSGAVDQKSSADFGSTEARGFENEPYDGSDLEVVEGGELTLEPLPAKRADSAKDGADAKLNSAETSETEIKAEDELTLAPPVELDPDLLEAQKESLLVDEVLSVELDEVRAVEPADDDATDDLMELEPLTLENTPFELEKPAAESKVKADRPSDGGGGDDDDDSDEMIELLDVPPEVANQMHSEAAGTQGRGESMVSKSTAGVAGSTSNGSQDDTDAPVRVHARRRTKKTTPASNSESKKKASFSSIEDSSLSVILDRSFGVLKTGAIWIWATVAVLLMWVGNAVWHGLGPGAAPEDVTFWQNILNYGIGITVGRLPFWSGYIVLMFLGGVIFRETAKGNDKVGKMTPTDVADFTSTMLLFGFSMFLAALPFFLLYSFIWIPIQLFLAGVFLFCAWQNQSAFGIVSSSVFTSFSRHAASWKKWAAVTAVAACGGFVAGLMLEINWSVLSVFTSLVGSLILTFTTLIYAAVTGWHAGSFMDGDQTNV